MDENTSILKVINSDGKMEEIMVVMYFTLETDGKDYIIYTENTNKENTMLYASMVEETEEEITLKEIADKKIIEEINNIIAEVENV